MLWPWLLLSLLPHVVSARHVSSYSGRYLFVYGRVYDCLLGEHGFDGTTIHHMRYSRYNPVRRYEPQAIFGNVTRTVELNDSYWVRGWVVTKPHAGCSVNFAIWSNNQWKDNAFVINVRSKACYLFFKNQPDFFRLTGGVVNGDSCVLRVGTFKYHGERRACRLSMFGDLPFGRYRVRTTHGLGSCVSSCFYNEVRVIQDASR